MKKSSNSWMTLIVLYTLLTIGTFIMTVLPALMPGLVELYSDMSEGKIGYIIGTMTLTMAGAGVIMGYFGDKVRRMQIACIGSTITTIFTLLSGFTNSYLQLFLCQVGASLGLGATLPVMASIIADSFPQEKRGRAFGVLSIITTVLGELGGFVIALILFPDNWRMTYYIMGGISAIITPILFFTKEPKRGAQEEALQAVYQEDPTLNYSYKIKKEDLKYLWKRKTNLYLILNFVDNIPGAVFATYAIAWLMIDHNASEDSAFMGLIVVVFGIFIGTIVFGWFGDKRYSKDKKIKVKLGTILSMASAPFILIGINLKWTLADDASLFSNPLGTIAVIMLAIGLLIDGGIYPNWLSAITDVNLPEHRSTMISLGNFFDACGRALGAFIGGFLIDNFNYPFAMTFASLFTILSFVWWVPSLKTYKKDYDDVQQIIQERAEYLSERVERKEC
ncbi:MAG: MFS transporter [Promethearchaeota archaeon]|nr:MAG: MFS transporter [Candidatus Lokiarchaeota archaeon]